MDSKHLPVEPFSDAEFHSRVERTRELMRAQNLDAVFLTAEPNVEYLAGFVTLFAWNSPSRPWYFLLPLEGDPVGIIPEAGESNWRETSWVERILTWPSPRPEDEGLSLLSATMRDFPNRFGRIGAELGPETRLQMPVADFLGLCEMIKPFDLVDCSSVMREARIIKSPAEVDRIRAACTIVCDAFDELPQQFSPGDSERAVAQKFQADIMLRGAEKTPYVAMSSGHGGYLSSSTWPSDRTLGEGDVFMIDTGSRFGGYFCDFNRNFAIGKASDEIRHAQEALIAATSAGIAAAKPGATAAELFDAQLETLLAQGVHAGSIGRFGHGLGKLLTEWPSNMRDDHTVLRPGMIMTIEPSLLLSSGRPMLHEEDLLINEHGNELLTRPAGPEICEIEI